MLEQWTWAPWTYLNLGNTDINSPRPKSLRPQLSGVTYPWGPAQYKMLVKRVWSPWQREILTDFKKKFTRPFLMIIVLYSTTPRQNLNFSHIGDGLVSINDNILKQYKLSKLLFTEYNIKNINVSCPLSFKYCSYFIYYQLSCPLFYLWPELSYYFLITEGEG